LHDVPQLLQYFHDRISLLDQQMDAYNITLKRVPYGLLTYPARFPMPLVVLARNLADARHTTTSLHLTGPLSPKLHSSG
jgi:hypothetical protein